MLFLLAHGKGPVCRVPVFQHTAKVLVHGNLRVSGSASVLHRCFLLEPRVGLELYCFFYFLLTKLARFERERLDLWTLLGSIYISLVEMHK